MFADYSVLVVGVWEDVAKNIICKFINIEWHPDHTVSVRFILSLRR